MVGQALVQLEGIGATVGWSAAVTLALIAVTRRLTGLRASDEEMDEGLDMTYHGERAYSQ